MRRTVPIRNSKRGVMLRIQTTISIGIKGQVMPVAQLKSLDEQDSSSSEDTRRSNSAPENCSSEERLEIT